MTDTDDTYDLVDTGSRVAVPGGTSLLVTAPAAVGRAFVLDVLAAGTGRRDGTLLITNDESAAAVRSGFRERIPGRTGPPDAAEMDGEGPAETDRLLRIIDCQTGETGLDDGDPVLLQDVDTPRNLTDLGIGFANALDAFEDVGVDRVRTGLLSLSVTLSYVDQETTYRFCQTVTRRIRRESYLGLFTVNADAHDDRTVGTLARAFDGVVEGRRDGDGYQVRFDGVDDAPEGWVG
jgi:KaiC/GvpD/RAD55 family RecA-like ATPase